MLSDVKLQYLTCQLQSERLFVKCVLDTAHWKWPAQGTSTAPIVSAHFRSLFVTMTWLYFAIGKFAAFLLCRLLFNALLHVACKALRTQEFPGNIILSDTGVTLQHLYAACTPKMSEDATTSTEHLGKPSGQRAWDSSRLHSGR